MDEVWAQVAIQIPIVVAMALLILQLRKLETAERKARDDQWQAFLADREKLRLEAQEARDEQWRSCLTSISDTNKAINATLIAQLDGLSTQMQAVFTQMQAVQISVERTHAVERAKE